MKRILVKIFFILLGILILGYISVAAWFAQEKSGIISSHKREMKVIEVNNEVNKDKLLNDFNNKKHLATGKNVYQRIRNKQNQDIVSLISNLANEALPKDWPSETKIEEFTNFILLIQIKRNAGRPLAEQIAKHIKPIIEYSYPYLNNVAVFDASHKCYLYFDKNVLNRLRSINILAPKDILDIEQKGIKFTKFNSIKIDFEVIEGHILIPVIVGGVESCIMMLDTGASITVISKEVAFKTALQEEELRAAEIRTFSTAKGKLQCPIVKLNISLGAIDREMRIAVNFNDDMNLLGVDFFKGFNYSIDSKDNCIYIWED